MSALNRSGTFTAKPVQADVRKSSRSAALSVAILFETMHEKAGEGWSDAPGETVYSDSWVVDSNGRVNERAVQSLVESLGWDGNLDSVGVSFPGPEAACQIVVEENVYEGKTTYKVAWINPYDSERGSGAIAGAVDEKEKKTLQAQYGGLLKAAAGGGAKKPAGGPKAAPGRAAPAAAPAVKGAKAPSEPIDPEKVPF